jgi:hypothetical protein
MESSSKTNFKPGAMLDLNFSFEPTNFVSKLKNSLIETHDLNPRWHQKF